MSFRIGRKYAQHTYPERRPADISQLAHDFADNGGPGSTDVSAAGVILASVTVTPRISGKFKLSASVVARNGDDARHTVSLQFGHGGVGEYPPSPNAVSVGTAGTVPTVFVGLEAENGVPFLYPFVAPLNAPVTFDLFAFADQDGHITVPRNGGQLTVEELAN